METPYNIFPIHVVFLCFLVPDRHKRTLYTTFSLLAVFFNVVFFLFNDESRAVLAVGGETVCQSATHV